MALYPKKLNSLEELRREKYALKFAQKQADDNEFFSVESKDAGGVANASIVGTALSLLTSRSLLNTIITVAPSLINLTGSKKAKNTFIQRFAKEIIGGYVKWKMVQMGLRGIKMFVRSRKGKNLKDD